MKMQKELFNKIKQEIEALLEKYNSNGELVEEYETGQFSRSEKVQDLQVRFMWDLYWATGLNSEVCSNHRELNNDHIETALRRICPQITRRY